MATCSHQDESRRGVSATALGVAFLRSIEKTLHPHDAICDDPYADALAGDYKLKYMKDCVEGNEPANKRYRRLINIGPARTRKIDDFMKDALEEGLQQICVLGAGVDARPWRLQTALPDQSHIKYYEIDFPEIFDYKLPILQAHGAKELFDYKKVEADLSLSTWLEKLEGAGFDRRARTLWLLEGLTGYLTEDELRAMFGSIGTFSAPGSRMIVTFLTPVILKNHQSLHKFAPEDPLSFVKEFSWDGVQHDLEDCCTELGRSNLPEDIERGYFLLNLIL